MASASRPRKSSARSTGLPARAPDFARASSGKGVAPKCDALELYVALIAGAENLSVNAARGLLRLRQAQLNARDGARGALLKVELRADGGYDLIASAANSPLLGDFFSLIVLQLIEDFPARDADLRALLEARRKGLDPSKVLRALWAIGGADENAAIAKCHAINEDLLGACTWVAAKPIIEALAASILRHRKAPLPASTACPICAGRPYARQGRLVLCANCEQRWPGQAEVPKIEDDLQPFDARPLAALARELAD